MDDLRHLIRLAAGKKIVCILGPTASGKTRLAVRLADALGAEILSADSRQVYRGMDLGTGKDLEDYDLIREDGSRVHIPYHLIDIAEAGERYDIHRYQRDFSDACRDILSRGRRILVCGGSGLYLEAALLNYDIPDVPADPDLRRALEQESDETLVARLSALKPLHNKTDCDSRKRLIRALEIELYRQAHPERDLHGNPDRLEFAPEDICWIGTWVSREERNRRIGRRLRERLEAGMADEVRRLLGRGIPPEDLIYYGLEYKYLTLYVTGRLSREAMEEQLGTAIRQFAKRQMTWFRGMERRGIPICWVDPETGSPVQMTACSAAVDPDTDLEGWMLYPAYTRERPDNAFGWFAEEGRRIGIRIRTRFFEDFSEDLSFGFPDAPFRPDFILMRGYDSAVSRFFETRDIPVFSPSRAMELSRDKWETYRCLTAAGIPTPETLPGPGTYAGFAEKFGPVFVLKQRIGSKGENVFLVSGPESFERAAAACDRYLCQRYIAASTGRDLRVWVIDGRAAAAVMRHNDRSFKSNFAQGGTASPFPLSPEAAKLAGQAAQAVGLFFAGIDLLFLPDGGFTVCEVNGNAGFRTLCLPAVRGESASPDLPALLLRAIRKSLKKRKQTPISGPDAANGPGPDAREG